MSQNKKADELVEPVVESIVQSVEPAEQAIAVDPNVVTLSSGIEVRFKVIPSQIIQKAVSDVMGGVKRDAKNNLSFQAGKEFDAIRSVTKYHDILITMGVELTKPLEEVATPTQLAQLDILMGGESVEVVRIYTFLRYFAFVTPEDFTLLTEKTINLVE